MEWANCGSDRERLWEPSKLHARNKGDHLRFFEPRAFVIARDCAQAFRHFLLTCSYISSGVILLVLFSIYRPSKTAFADGSQEDCTLYLLRRNFFYSGYWSDEWITHWHPMKSWYFNTRQEVRVNDRRVILYVIVIEICLSWIINCRLKFGFK